jgi:LuxR family maltose regulon positive regulatory protein
MNLHIVDSELTLKATPPRTAQSFVAREQLALAGLLLRGHSPIVVGAPAGYGKTSVLAQWRKEALARGAICAWLTLDERDTAVRLIRGLHMARALARGTAPSTAALSLLLEPDREPLDAATSWLADMAATAPDIVFFLDDVHTVRCEAARQVLEYVVRNCPANMTFVLASRSSIDPATSAFASCASRTARTVTAIDLRLTVEESARVVGLQMACKPESNLAARLHELSGGWPLGLQLIVSALRGNPDPNAVAEVIAIESGDIARYFRQCLDGRLSLELMHFLLQISVVDFVTPALCVFLTEREDAEQVLRELCLVTPLFGEATADGWFRMHALGLDFLRERARRTLPALELARLNVAASKWFDLQGMPEPAARHALAGGCTAAAFDLAERCMPMLLDVGDFSRILEWLERIPAPQILVRPGISSAAIWAMAVYIKRDGRADALIEAILDSPTSSVEAKEDAAAALLFMSEGDDAPERGRQRLSRWPHVPAGRHPRQVQVRRILSVLETLNAGDPQEARRMCERELAACAAPHFFIAHTSFVSILAYTHFWEGHVDVAAMVLRQLTARIATIFGRRSISATTVDVSYAIALWESGDDAEAASLMADRADMMERLASFRLVMHSHITLARIALQGGNEARALSVLDSLYVIGQVRGIPRLQWEALAEQLRIHAHANRGKSCAMVLERLEAMGASVEARASLRSAPILDLRLSVSRTYAWIAADDFPRALAEVKIAAQLAIDLQLGHEGIATQLLLALCKYKLGETHEAILEKAVALAEAHGLRRIVRTTHPDIQPLIDVMRHGTSEPTLAAPAHVLPAPIAAPTSAPVRIMPSTLLTPKEREVLRHLAEGCANKRIGNILGVTDETVKWHVKNLSAKLGGANRRHVVDRARQMGIIG